MKSINVDVFTFDELSDEVKAKLVEENRYEFDVRGALKRCV